MVKPDKEEVYREYGKREQMFDCLQYRDEEGCSWTELANFFVLEKHNEKINNFIDRVNNAKKEAERKMRRQLDRRCL